jgi:excisionase family DNA binding protein
MRYSLDPMETRDPENGLPILVTVEEAALMLNIGRTNAYQFVMSGQIQSVKIGRRRLVVRAGVQNFVDELIRTQSE